MTATIPNPGSRAALDQGCTCPVLDNWRGSDELGRIRGFIVYEGCPVHASSPTKDKHSPANQGETT